MTRRSVGAAPSRNGGPSFAAREHARPVPGILKAWHLPKCSGATSKPPRERPIRQTPTQFLAMPRGRAAPGDPPHLPMGSPSSMESYGPQTSQTLTMCPRANRPPAVGCSGRVLEQPLERPLDRARAGAQAPIPKDAPPSRLAATEKRRKPSSNRQISQLLWRVSGYTVR